MPMVMLQSTVQGIPQWLLPCLQPPGGKCQCFQPTHWVAAQLPAVLRNWSIDSPKKSCEVLSILRYDDTIPPIRRIERSRGLLCFTPKIVKEEKLKNSVDFKAAWVPKTPFLAGVEPWCSWAERFSDWICTGTEEACRGWFYGSLVPTCPVDVGFITAISHPETPTTPKASAALKKAWKAVTISANTHESRGWC